MTAEEFKAIRQARNESRIDFGRALGMTAKPGNVDRLIRRIENGEKEVTPQVAIKALQLKREIG